MDAQNQGMHDSIFIKIWGDAGGGEVGRIALAKYAFELGVTSKQSGIPEWKCGDPPDLETQARIQMLEEEVAQQKVWKSEWNAHYNDVASVLMRYIPVPEAHVSVRMAPTTSRGE